MPFATSAAQNVNEIIMFGGEYVHLETGRVKVNNDLYRFNADKQRWSKVNCPGR